MDAPKRIWACPDTQDGWRWPYASEHPVQHSLSHKGRMFVEETEHARIVAEKDARIARLREACNQSRLAFAGYVSAQSAIDALDRSALKGDDNG